MQALKDFIASWSGWRTYIAHGAQVCVALSAILTVAVTYAGGITLEHGVALTAVLGGASQLLAALGGVFQRMATQSLQQDLAELPSDVKNVKAIIQDLESLPTKPSGTAQSVAGAIVLVLLLGSSASAQAVVGAPMFEIAKPPIAVIVGPKMAEPGDEIILDASASEGEPHLFKWVVVPEVKGKKQITAIDGGKKIRLASWKGQYEVEVMIANKYGIDSHKMTITVMDIEPPEPAPAPKPTPTPSPAPAPTPAPVIVPVVPVPAPVVPVPVPTPVGPVLPAGNFDNLPSAVYQLAMGVNTTSRASEAGKLADALEGVAAQLSAGTLKTPLGIVDAIGKAFNGAVPASWDTDFRTKAVAKMKSLYEGGKLPIPDAWATMLREVVTGLRAVK